MQVKKFSTIMTGYIRPIDNIELFEHCTGGRPSVTEKEFDKTVRPLLLAHGVLEIRIV